jgi:hypothetical protein
LIASKLKKPLLRKLDAVLGASGFRRISDKLHGDRYSRESVGIRCSIHVSFVPRSDAVVVEVPSVSIRFDRVEETIARYEDPHPLVTPDDVAARPTLSVQTDSRLIGGLLRKSWTVRAEEEIAKVADQIAAYASEKGEPVFAKLSSPESALQILASDDEKAKSYAAPDEVRAKKAIGVALIFEGPEAAKRVAEAKLATLKGDARSAVSLWFDRLWSDIQHGSAEQESR